MRPSSSDAKRPGVSRCSAADGRRVVRADQEALAHVRDVEEPGVLARPAMLGEDALVLHRHRITGEWHHARAELDMQGIERCAAERLGVFGHRVPSRVLHEARDMRPSVPPLSEDLRDSRAARPIRRAGYSVGGPAGRARQPLSRASLALRGPCRLRVSGAVAPSAPGRRSRAGLSRAASSYMRIATESAAGSHGRKTPRSSIGRPALTTGRTKPSLGVGRDIRLLWLAWLRCGRRLASTRRRRRLDCRDRRLAAVHRVPFADIEADIEDVVRGREPGEGTRISFTCVKTADPASGIATSNGVVLRW